MQERNFTRDGMILSVCLHLGVLLLFLISGWLPDKTALPDSKGEPVQASVMISAADIARAERAIRDSQAAPPPKPAEAIQPQPEPNPQTAESPQQMQAQAPIVNPDDEDQQRIDKLALQASEEKIKAEQEAKQRQAQIDLTDDIEKQKMAERKQRLREQQLAELNAIRLAQKAAADRTRMEDQRMRQLEDLRATPSPARTPNNTGSPRVAGNPDANNDLLARYKAAIKATIDNNWRRGGAEPLQRCQVILTQIPGGEVIDVSFIDCPFSPEGVENAERAVRLTPLPYSGFESVFARKQTFTFCYPTEQCEK